MTRVVYGVSGEGSGHSSRAREVTRHLLEAGHEVRIATYDRGVRNLAGDFDVHEIEGLHIATADNRVQLVKTFTENLARLSGGIRSLRGLRRELFEGFEPEVVLTDFEPMTAHLAGHLEVPLVSLDNQHRMRYMRFPCPDSMRNDARLTKAVIRALVPRPGLSLVTTFYRGELKNDHTELFPPILRREVLAAEPREGEHVLVYCTKGFDSLLTLLGAAFPRERFRVYGVDADASVAANLELCEPSREGFLDDLAGAKAVVATAGFTLMTECLHLGKPLLALPMRGQFEQELNALLLDELACGRSGRAVSREVVGEFLYRLPELREALASERNPGNGALFARLDEVLADGGALARAYQERRREA